MHGVVVSTSMCSNGYTCCILWKSTLNSSNVLFRLDSLELRDNVYAFTLTCTVCNNRSICLIT